MKRFNSKGQFSVIAALLVAVVLVGAVVTTYSSIHYGAPGEQPQILSAIDETNLGIREILGFTVGYYGSVLKVTGNNTYAEQLATNYLDSGLANIGDVNPEWGAVFSLNNLSLGANWFSNESYSQGEINVNYNLTGMGIYGVNYNASISLNVQVVGAPSPTKTQLIILRDGNEPLINLGKENLKFYTYNYDQSVWNLSSPANIASYVNGTYVLDLPPNLASNAYVLQISDTRGLMAMVSSFTGFTTSVTWNSSSWSQMLDYVDLANQDITGTHSNFAAQQDGPDSVYDTLTEQPFGLGALNYAPLSVNLLGSTTAQSPSGNITTDTLNNDGNYLTLHSYPSAFSGNQIMGYSVKGTSTSANIENRMTGSLFTTTASGQLQSISVYLTATVQNHNVKVAIYQASDKSLVAGSTPKTIIPGDNGWVTFTFSDPKPMLNADTNYILVAWAEGASGSVYMYFDAGSSNQGYLDAIHNYGTWPNPNPNLNSDYSSNKYSINCSYTEVTQFKVQAEFSGTSDSINWQQLTWAVDSAVTTGTASCTLQLYNTVTGYPAGGDGYINTELGTSDSLQTQTITSNPTNFRNSSYGWKLMVTATNTSAAQFDLKIDLARFTSQFTNYAVNLQEQWLNVDSSIARQDLCIKTGNMGSEPLVVQVLHSGSWINLMSLVPNHFNNVSLAPYIDSSNLTIRFVGSNDLADPTSDSYQIDCVYLKDEPDITYLVNRQQSTFTVELLQNGTMRWLGQNMQVTGGQTIPIPPVSVKAIHVNQTINGVNQEVPFQIEDWASNYQIPLGLTSNATVFSNRQMIVFLLNSHVTDFTVWWDGSDAAAQTPMAYTNRFFTADDTSSSTYNNGNLSLVFSDGTVKATVAGTNTYSTATFMRANQEPSSYGSGTSLVIHHGIVRDIAMEEAEWGTTGTGIGGADGCPNMYANIIILLPANATYYNYQLRFMFIDSTPSRTITDLCPLKLTTSVSPTTLQTENGTIADFPIVVNGTATYPNYASSGYTDHHFMQFMQDSGKGAGIMFSDTQNVRLYVFDSFPSSTSKGGLKTSTTTLELLPVIYDPPKQVVFQSSYDITWQGAVATFDSSNTPICNFYDATTPMGLWILAEYPPTLALTPIA